MKKRIKITPVLLSGGSGVRLWPISRKNYPKQFLFFGSKKSLLQESLNRSDKRSLFSDPLVVCNQDHRFVVAEQSKNIGIKNRKIILEPVGRNTAPAVAVASIIAQSQSKNSYLLVTPTDHKIEKTERFYTAIKNGVNAASKGLMVTFGVMPSSPNTGYGYIRAGKKIENSSNCFSGIKFIEKPNEKAAKKILKEKNWYWNSGIFLFKTEVFLNHLKRLHPKIYKYCELAVNKSSKDLDFLRIHEQSFKKSPAISLDHAIMEQVGNFAVVPVNMGWNDVGSWDALWETSKKDRNGNVQIGDVYASNVKNSYINSKEKLVAAVGLENIFVVATKDSVLVSSKDQAAHLKSLVNKLTSDKRTEIESHTKVYRPWGSYETLCVGDNFQAKHIIVNRNSQLSLQKHNKRSEHWVVTKGVARITKGKTTFLLRKNTSTFIPIKTIHRIKNIGKTRLHIIEIQCGKYLGEDDIVRIRDDYGRMKL